MRLLTASWKDEWGLIIVLSAAITDPKFKVLVAGVKAQRLRKLKNRVLRLQARPLLVPLVPQMLVWHQR